MRCIIFVERKIATRVLASLLGSIEVLSSRLRFQPLAGKSSGLNVMNHKLQQHVVDSFRDGKVSISDIFWPNCATCWKVIGLKCVIHLPGHEELCYYTGSASSIMTRVINLYQMFSYGGGCRCFVTRSWEIEVKIGLECVNCFPTLSCRNLVLKTTEQVLS